MINTFKQKIVNSIVKAVNESGGKIEPKTKIKIITTDQELNEIIETVELIKITIEKNKTNLTIRYPEYNEETKKWMLEEDSKKENTFDINEMSLQELAYLVEKMHLPLQTTYKNQEEFEPVGWPEIQLLIEKEGFEENSYLINDEQGIEDFGYSAYFVRKSWLEKATENA